MELQIAHLGKVSVTPEGEHSNRRKYKKLSLVTVSDSEHVATFISLKYVPYRTSILNTKYWMRLGFDPAVELPKVPTIRTINHEQLTDSTQGDANLLDGFYFPNAVQDYDGNWYGAIIMGDQVWLAENLRSTHYSDGTSVNTYDVPNDDTDLIDTYGLLYPYDVVTHNNATTERIQGLAPNGWYIPTSSDVYSARNYLKKQSRVLIYTGSLAKALASSNGWISASNSRVPGYNQETNNITGFNAYPAGGKYNFGKGTCFWTSTPNGNANAYAWEIHNGDPAAGVSNLTARTTKLSVRCISNLTPIQFRNWYIQQYGSLNHIVDEDNNGTFIVHLTLGENNAITSDSSIQDIIEKSTSNNIIAVVASEESNMIFNLTYVDRSTNFISFSVAISVYNFVGFIYIVGVIEDETDTWRTDNPLELSHLINMPRIPTPTPEDAGKVLKVDEEGNYYLD